MDGLRHHPSSDRYAATFSHKGRRGRLRCGWGKFGRQRFAVAFMPPTSLLPLWEKVASR